MRSDVGAICPLSFFLRDVFFVVLCALEVADVLVFDVCACAGSVFAHTATPSPKSTIDTRRMNCMANAPPVCVFRKKKRRGFPRLFPSILTCCPPAPRPAKTQSACDRYRRDAEP